MLSHTAKKRLEQLPKLSVAGKRINGLFNLMKCDLLWEDALSRVARNKGARTPGVDGQTFAGFGTERMNRLQTRVFKGAWRPAPGSPGVHSQSQRQDTPSGHSDGRRPPRAGCGAQSPRTDLRACVLRAQSRVPRGALVPYGPGSYPGCLDRHEVVRRCRCGRLFRQHRSRHPARTSAQTDRRRKIHRSDRCRC